MEPKLETLPFPVNPGPYALIFKDGNGQTLVASITKALWDNREVPAIPVDMVQVTAQTPPAECLWWKHQIKPNEFVYIHVMTGLGLTWDAGTNWLNTIVSNDPFGGIFGSLGSLAQTPPAQITPDQPFGGSVWRQDGDLIVASHSASSAEQRLIAKGNEVIIGTIAQSTSWIQQPFPVDPVSLDLALEQRKLHRVAPYSHIVMKRYAIPAQGLILSCIQQVTAAKIVLKYGGDKSVLEKLSPLIHTVYGYIISIDLVAKTWKSAVSIRDGLNLQKQFEDNKEIDQLIAELASEDATLKRLHDDFTAYSGSLNKWRMQIQGDQMALWFAKMSAESAAHKYNDARNDWFRWPWEDSVEDCRRVLEAAEVVLKNRQVAFEEDLKNMNDAQRNSDETRKRIDEQNAAHEKNSRLLDALREEIKSLQIEKGVLGETKSFLEPLGRALDTMAAQSKLGIELNDIDFWATMLDNPEVKESFVKLHEVAEATPDGMVEYKPGKKLEADPDAITVIDKLLDLGARSIGSVGGVDLTQVKKDSFDMLVKNLQTA